MPSPEILSGVNMANLALYASTEILPITKRKEERVCVLCVAQAHLQYAHGLGVFSFWFFLRSANGAPVVCADTYLG